MLSLKHDGVRIFRLDIMTQADLSTRKTSIKAIIKSDKGVRTGDLEAHCRKGPLKTWFSQNVFLRIVVWGVVMCHPAWILWNEDYRSSFKMRFLLSPQKHIIRNVSQSELCARYLCRMLHKQLILLYTYGTGTLSILL